MTPLLLAALSAVLYGSGAAFEHCQAARTSPESAGRVRLVAVLARQPLWLTGVALEAGGFAAHAAALSGGPLAVVQLVLACSMVVSIVVSARLSLRRLPRRSWPAMLAVVAAVGGSVVLLRPDQYSAGQTPGRVAMAVLVTCAATIPFAAAGLLARGRRSRARLLAAAAGLADASVAVLTMAFAHSFAHGPGAVLTSWPLYALIAGGLVSVAVTQAAYQADLPLITLPVMATVTPLASLAVGIFALGETADMSGARWAAVLACVVVAVAALAVLAGGEGRGRPAGRAGAPAGPIRQLPVPGPRAGSPGSVQEPLPWPAAVMAGDRSRSAISAGR
jgi:drug/metabolite transporter (DMT)-like permease